MDRDQDEIQFLGFFGIFKESLNITSTYKKIFSQITLAIILPLSFIYLAHIEISELLFGKIANNEYALDRTQAGTPKYARLSNILSSEWTTFWLFKIVYFLFFLILSLLSTAAVVYSIASIYTAKEVTFKKVMSVVPKVWKRLMVTFFWNFLIVFAYNIVAILVLVLWVFLTGPTVAGLVILVILLIVYFMGFVYINVVWHLASVVSVLEDVYGIQAMIKSRVLIKGKSGLAISIFLLLILCFVGLHMLYELEVVAWDGSVWGRVFYGVICFLLLSMLILFGLIIQTVIYFVCKSYHHENIDKSLLADHLEVYLGDYVPLKSKDVQLEHFYV